MTTPTTIGVDDDLATREPGITLRSTGHETAGGVHEILGGIAQHITWQGRLDDLINHKILDLRMIDGSSVLR